MHPLDMLIARPEYRRDAVIDKFVWLCLRCAALVGRRVDCGLWPNKSTSKSIAPKDSTDLGMMGLTGRLAQRRPNPFSGEPAKTPHEKANTKNQNHFLLFFFNEAP
jgi:hypothetical protein